MTSYGSARFGTIEDAQAHGLTEGSGIVLGRLGTTYLRIASPKHVAFVGPSDSGKTSSAVSTLLGWPDDVFVLTLKPPHLHGSLWATTAAYRAKTFGPTYLFAPADPYSPDRLNPFECVRWGGPLESVDVQRMAIRLTTRSDIDIRQEGPSYYRHGAQGVLFLGMLCQQHLWHDGTHSPSGLQSMLVAAKPPYSKIAQALSVHAHQGIRKQAMFLGQQPERDLAKWWLDAIGHLDAWKDPVLAHNTDTSTIPLRQLQVGPKPMSVYVHITPEDIADRLASFFQVIIQQLRTLSHESTATDRRRLLVVLDDMGELRRFTDVLHMASFDRDFGWRLLLLFQSFSQLWEVLGPHASLLDNLAATLAFRPNHPETASFLSAWLDDMTVTTPVERRSSGRFGSTISEGDQSHARRLLRPREIHEIGDQEALLFASGAPPFRVLQPRYYQEPYWAACAQTDLGPVSAVSARLHGHTDLGDRVAQSGSHPLVKERIDE